MKELLNDLAAGGVAGLSEVTAFYWTVPLKNSQQTGMPAPNSFRTLYKGFGMNAACTTVFFSVMNGFNQWAKKKQEELEGGNGHSFSSKVLPAAFGGVAASLILNPVEVANVQRNGTNSLFKTLNNIYQKEGILKGFYRGASLAFARNSLYSVGLNAVGPMAKEMAEEYIAAPLSTVVGIGSAGLVVGTATHAVDTLKTLVQSKKFATTKEAFGGLCNSGKMFSGLFWRNVRMTGGPVVAFSALELMRQMTDQV